LWSPAYFAASAGGAPLAIIKQYGAPLAILKPYGEQQRQRASSSPSKARLPRAEKFGDPAPAALRNCDWETDRNPQPTQKENRPGGNKPRSRSV
jgi:hypothetical protein